MKSTSSKESEMLKHTFTMMDDSILVVGVRGADRVVGGTEYAAIVEEYRIFDGMKYEGMKGNTSVVAVDRVNELSDEDTILAAVVPFDMERHLGTSRVSA